MALKLLLFCASDPKTVNHFYEFKINRKFFFLLHMFFCKHKFSPEKLHFLVQSSERVVNGFHGNFFFFSVFGFPCWVLFSGPFIFLSRCPCWSSCSSLLLHPLSPAPCYVTQWHPAIVVVPHAFLCSWFPPQDFVSFTATTTELNKTKAKICKAKAKVT